MKQNNIHSMLIIVNLQISLDQYLNLLTRKHQISVR